MKKYDLVIFDLDGTILDTTQGVLAAVKYTIEQMNFEMLPDEQLATFIDHRFKIHLQKHITYPEIFCRI